MTKIVTLVKENRITTSNVPYDVEPFLEKAIQYKRTAQYEESLQIYLDVFSSLGVVHTGVLNGLFKVVAAAGFCKETRELLEIGDKAIKASNTIFNPFGMPNNFEDHLQRLEQAIRSRDTLESYLMSIAGNIHYSLPRTYSEILSDYLM